MHDAKKGEPLTILLGVRAYEQMQKAAMKRFEFYVGRDFVREAPWFAIISLWRRRDLMTSAADMLMRTLVALEISVTLRFHGFLATPDDCIRIFTPHIGFHSDAGEIARRLAGGDE